MVVRNVNTPPNQTIWCHKPEGDNMNLRNYSVVGLCPSSGILKDTEGHKVSETGSVSVLR
jgi:hypothetical protein